MGCFRETRLIPKEHNVFYVAGWSYEAALHGNDAGSVARVRIEATEDGWPRCGGVYTKET